MLVQKKPISKAHSAAVDIVTAFPITPENIRHIPRVFKGERSKKEKGTNGSFCQKACSVTHHLSRGPRALLNKSNIEKSESTIVGRSFVRFECSDFFDLPS